MSVNGLFLLSKNGDNKELIYLSHDGLESYYSLPPYILLNENSQIKYLKGLDNLVILSNSTIYIVNNKGNVLKSAPVENCTEITVDLDKIYARCGNTIKVLNINNSITIEDNEISIPNSDSIKNISFDIINRKMYAFNTERSCLVYFDCNLNNNPFTNPNISDNTPLTSSTTILPINIKYSCLIYDYPYELGNYYNQDQSITSCIGIGEYLNYYQILFNNNNSLHIGYIPKSNVEIIDYKYNPIKVIPTHQKIHIYKYPTILKYNNERIVTEVIEDNSQITLSYLFPVSIDERTFYMYKKQDNIGFISSIDIVLDENTNIKNLNTENASVNIIDNEITQIPLLKEDKETLVINITNESRIYVENYDKHSDYTKIIYKDSDLNTYEGYIETKYIQMDKLETSDIVLIIIIIFSIILLILIAVAYFVIKRKNK